VLFWSAHIQKLLGYQAPEFTGSAWIPAVFATVVFLYGGVVFLKGAWRELKSRLSASTVIVAINAQLLNRTRL
jgi:Cu2+-exporting ATPase